MSFEQKLISDLQKLTEKLNMQARTNAGFDPLFDANFSFENLSSTSSFESSERELAETSITIRATYSSGHGEEGVYMLCQSVAFKLNNGFIKDIVFQNSDNEKLNDIKLDGSAEKVLVEKIRFFFEAIFPEKMLDDK